jgi:medium-chain acyl-[acyl-carrier-protein] hydrolase
MVGRGEAVWSETFRVRAYEVGPSGWVSAPALCNWLQESAGNHATSLGWAVDELQQQGLTWVLSRFHLRLNRYPRWRDDIEVATWPSGVQRLFALREFRITATDGGELGVATTAWLLVNASTLRPVRPPATVEEVAQEAPGRVLDDPFAKLPEVANVELQAAVDVRFADLDMNRHANNVSLIAAVLEPVPEDVALGRSLAELEVEFRSETVHGDRLRVEAQQAPSGSLRFLHRIVRESDGREIARARTVWVAADTD